MQSRKPSHDNRRYQLSTLRRYGVNYCCANVKNCKKFSKCCISISYEKTLNTIYILFRYVNILSPFFSPLFKKYTQNEQSVN